MGEIVLRTSEVSELVCAFLTEGVRDSSMQDQKPPSLSLSNPGHSYQRSVSRGRHERAVTLGECEEQPLGVKLLESGVTPCVDAVLAGGSSAAWGWRGLVHSSWFWPWCSWGLRCSGAASSPSPWACTSSSFNARSCRKLHISTLHVLGGFLSSLERPAEQCDGLSCVPTNSHSPTLPPEAFQKVIKVPCGPPGGAPVG